MTRLSVLLFIAALAHAADWSAAVEVRHEDNLCVSYQARLDGPMLVVRATLGAGWHTFAMDNEQRAKEKLAGKPALSMDRNTAIAPMEGLEIVGPWLQSPPQDFSRPQLRWYSWGYDREALFAAKVRDSAGAGARLRLRGQACTDTICKNVDVTITLPHTSPSASTIDLKDLVPVR